MSARVALALALCVVLSSCDGEEPPRANECRPRGVLTPGERIPDCTFERVFGGEPLALAALRGKPLVVNFWASWCTYCIREMPTFEKVYRDLDGRFELVGMDLLGVEAERTQDAERFARKTKVTYPLAYDRGGLFYAHFGGSTRRPTMPLTVFIDANGTVTFRKFGPYEEDGFRAELRRQFGIG